MVLLVTALLMASRVGVADEESASAQFEEIKTRLSALDQQQKEILANQVKIFDKLDQLRIWVHRK